MPPPLHKKREGCLGRICTRLGEKGDGHVIFATIRRESKGVSVTDRRGTKVVYVRVF